MIKSFKDFDNELKGQKIYEAFDDVREENENEDILMLRNAFLFA